MTLPPKNAIKNETAKPMIPNNKLPSWTNKIAGNISAPSTAYGIFRSTPETIGGNSFPSKNVRDHLGI